MHSAPRALIAGLGLIGGSIGMALRARGWRIAFLDPNVDLQQARSAGAAEERVEKIGDADLVIVATPVDVARELMGTGSLGTSVAGVMTPFKGAPNFVAGHPLAGSQQRGLAAARGDLFNGCTWFVERHEPLVDRMIEDCGANVEIVTAEEHDAAVALTSHLPQLLSTALAAHIDERGFDDRFAGSGLRTFLRLAGSDASVWMPIVDANRANIQPHADAIAKIVSEMLSGNGAAFERAQRLWSRLK